MFSTAFAQSAAGGAGAMGSGLQMILLFVPLMAIWYFLLIRPQRRQAKQRQETLAAIRRGDQIIAGGLVGKVTKVIDDSELEVENRGWRSYPHSAQLCLRSACQGASR